MRVADRSRRVSWRVRRQHAVVTVPMNPRRRHQGGEAVDELQWGQAQWAAAAGAGLGAPEAIGPSLRRVSEIPLRTAGRDVSLPASRTQAT